MNELGERALVQILRLFAPLAALVEDRVSWDEEEIDPAPKSVTLRTVATRFPGAGVSGRGGVRNSAIEISGHDDSSSGASRLADLIVAAMDPHDGKQLDVVLVDTGEIVRFGGIQMTDFQQSPSSRQNSYRKSAMFSVFLYE